MTDGSSNKNILTPPSSLQIIYGIALSSSENSFKWTFYIMGGGGGGGGSGGRRGRGAEEVGCGGGGGGEFCYNAGAWECGKVQTTGDRTSSTAFTLFLLCVPAISSSRSPQDQLPQTVKRGKK